MSDLAQAGRRLALAGALALMGAVACLANTYKFSVPVTADGAVLGQASATLKVTSRDRKVTWTLTDGQFTPDARREDKVVLSNDVLAGTGQVDAADSVVLKEFPVTLQQSTGVDITYSLRLRVTLSGDNIRAVSIEQAR